MNTPLRPTPRDVVERTMSSTFQIYRTDVKHRPLMGMGFHDRDLAEKAAQNWRDRVPSGTFEVVEITQQQQEDSARALRALVGKVGRQMV